MPSLTVLMLSVAVLLVAVGVAIAVHRRSALVVPVQVAIGTATVLTGLLNTVVVAGRL
ncbi:hypothetical protein [Streptomyces sp. ERV7]|uniref:hypothetical protein n=1 Tax=Streptomyces sp. ERV7 TaxID=1322334 RepID=UPI00131CF1FA|nr:hypothetical protein [Streptomyces sp. ERV7]